MVSVDTIRAYTYTNININYLIKNGWRKWVNRKDGTVSYFKKDKHLLFWYFPQGILLIKFSISKFYYGTNAKVFDLDNASLIIKLVNHRIKRILPSISSIVSFENWTCSEIHPFIHLYADNVKDKITYLECLKKLNYPRMEKHKYAMGIQARNGSRSINIYSKSDEIKFRADNKPSAISIEDLSINNIENIIRFEYQVKKRSLKYCFKNNRKVKDVLRKDFCQNMLLEVIKNSGLNNPFLYKKETISKIKKEFSKVKARNLIEFITDFNEKPEDFINAKYPKKTQSNYLRILKGMNINPVFLPDKVNKKIDFTNFEEPTKSNLQFSLLKIFLLIAILKLCNVPRKNYYIKTVALTSVFTAEAYYYEDGGG